MRNSPLVTYTLLSPYAWARTGAVEGLTIHHSAGVGTAADILRNFDGRRGVASANYCVGNDGSIGLGVPENMRAAASSSRVNDNRMVTIEVSNSENHYPWPVGDTAYKALIELCADICLRNGIEKLVYTGDTRGNLTAHRWFAATQCPGDYLYERFPVIAAEVNERLEELRMPRYNTVAELPNWAKDTVRRLCDRGIIRGSGAPKDAEGYPTDMNISEDVARVLVWNDRAGCYGADGDAALRSVMAAK